MSTLFMIGNGFDINCGMKTSYRNVYEKYIKEDSNTDVIKQFKNNIEGNFDTWGDFEIAMGEYAERLEREEDFIECVRDFLIFMRGYLVQENNAFKSLLTRKDVMKAVEENMAHSLVSFYDGISRNVDRLMEQRHATIYSGFDAISFNYTDVFDYLWNSILGQYNSNQITHVHGTLEEGIICGVDNIEQIKAKFDLSKKGRREFIKPILNSAYDEERVRIAKQKIKEASTICVYGMSLGDSDLSWRNELINWLKKERWHHLVIYKYSCSMEGWRTLPERLGKEEDAKELLISEWGIEETQELFEQIHIPCGRNIFNIDAVIKNKLREDSEAKEAEIQKKIERVKNFVQQNGQTVITT